MSSKQKEDHSEDGSGSDSDDDDSKTPQKSDAHSPGSARAAKIEEKNKTDAKASADAKAVTNAEKTVKKVVDAVKKHPAVKKKLLEATEKQRNHILQEFEKINKDHGSRTMGNLQKKVGRWWHELKNFLMKV